MMTLDELEIILDKHQRWINDEDGGERADLSGANLSGADLSGADLSGANLYRANLYRANLYRAKGCKKHLTTPLYGMLDQIGPIRAYKLVTDKFQGPHYPTITYRAGEEFKSKIDLDENTSCGEGINLATLDWVMREWQPGYHILIAEFEIKNPAKDICIPIGSDGKFRVRKCKIVGEKDLKELGLVKDEVQP